jgi:hypothetical protein
VLSLHLPLSAETRHLVNTHYIARFKKPIILINTSRGPVIDTAAVLEALDSGRFQVPPSTCMSMRSPASSPSTRVKVVICWSG